MKNNNAVLVCPGKSPETISISHGVKGLLEAFGIVEKKNLTYSKHTKVETEVIQIGKKAHIVCAENDSMLNAPISKTIGHISFYGTFIIINLDEYGELDEMTEIEAHHFCYVFDKVNIPLEIFNKEY